MDSVRVGASGLRISPIALGCMGFGDPARATHPWAVGEATAKEIIAAALEVGITTFDTANGYSNGASEEITGRALLGLVCRDQVVIATKVFTTVAPGPAGGGLSRLAIMAQVEQSLRRLGTDYIDLYQIHRYDPDVPIEETMDALNDLVRSGKVRYIGASSMWTWQFAQAQYVADRHGWTRFVSMQPQYNLLMREEEREMLPFCISEGVGVLPWSPLARGRLTRDWDAVTERARLDAFGGALYGQMPDNDRQIVEAVARIAAERGVARAQVALAWVMRQPGVTAPIVGATSLAHLRDAVGALEVGLTDAECALLECEYRPHVPEAFS